MKKYVHTVDADKMMFCTSSSRSTILSSVSTRDISRNMVRVRSSNLWSYGINVKEYGDKSGDVYVQFKGKNGGPDDIYVYYDVPVIIWRKMLAAPSKGHAFWQYIRNNYKYSKLTGDKRTKLSNGVSSL